MMRMMRAWTTAAILGSALVVAGPAASAEKVVFQFGWLPGGDRAAYYLASHVGLFAAEGTRRSASARQGIDRCADQDCDWRRRYGRRRPRCPAHREGAERDPRHGGDGDLYQGAGCARDDDGERHQDAEGCDRQDGRDVSLHLVERALAVPVADERRRSRDGQPDQSGSGRARAHARDRTGRRGHPIRDQCAGDRDDPAGSQEDNSHDSMGRLRPDRIFEFHLRLAQNARDTARHGGANSRVRSRKPSR